MNWNAGVDYDAAGAGMCAKVFAKLKSGARN